MLKALEYNKNNLDNNKNNKQNNMNFHMYLEVNCFEKLINQDSEIRSIVVFNNNADLILGRTFIPLDRTFKSAKKTFHFYCYYYYY
jgi:hypothetical protein